MKIYGADDINIKNLRKSGKNTVITIGNFDGLHKGHLKLIKKVCEIKNKENYKLSSVVLTFDINTKKCSNLIYEKGELEKTMKKADGFDIDFLVYLKFIDKIKNLSCEEFVKEYIVGLLCAKYVVVGENFFFGKNKEGNAETLKALGEKYGFETVIMPFYKKRGEIVSSTLIRSLISSGKIGYANSLLYKPFSFSGTVKKGYNIGSTILDIPTANINIPKSSVKLKNGVYATEVVVGNKTYKGVTNIGIAPINPKNEPLCETFILDFDQNIYRKKIKIIFIKYIRSEKSFESFSALKKQITHDINYRKEM